MSDIGDKNIPEKEPKVPAEPQTPKVSPKPVLQSKVTPKAAIGPVPPAKDDDSTINRRTFISWLAVAWTAFALATAGFLTTIIRYLFPNVLFEKSLQFKAGFPSDYTVGEVSIKWKATQGVWIVRTSESLYALSTVCTHLGCTPNWLKNEKKFKCPCHGSGFKKNGINFEGPAPRPLERYRIVLADDGQVLVDKSKKYQQEKGQWADPESFLVV